MLGFNKKTTARRKLIFVFFILGASLATLFLGNISWPKDISFQNLWGVASVCLAGTAGILALIKLMTRKKNKYAFIAGGFLGVALIELFSLFSVLPSTALLWMLS